MASDITRTWRGAIASGAAAQAKPMVAPPAAEEEPDVVERTHEEVTSSPTSLAAQTRRDAEGRTAVPSQMQPPILDALAQLDALGWRISKAEGKGDCSVLSMMAGHEIKDEAQVLNPSPDTLKLVQKARSAGVSIVVGTNPIGGITAKTFREQEGLCCTPQAAAKEMKAWRSNRHWYSEDNAHQSTAFLFGVSAHLGRPTIVLEQGEGGILDPCRVYAARNKNDALRRSPARIGKPETVPSWFPIKFAEVLAALMKDPSAYSVILYDGEVHFDPLVYGPAAPRAQADRAQLSYPPAAKTAAATKAAARKAAAEEATRKRAAEKAARKAQLQEQQRAVAREHANRWERERKAELAASRKQAHEARARAAKVEAEAKEQARVDQEHAQARRGRAKARRLIIPSLACLLLAAVGWARLPNVHPVATSFVEAVHASPFHESLFNGQLEHERPQRFHGRSDAWAPDEELTLGKILDDAVS